MATDSALLSRFFTLSALNRTVANSDASLFHKIQERFQSREEMTNAAVIRRAYEQLGKDYRNEYFYKNTLLNKILLGRHSMKTSAALRELPVAGSILDFLVINGIGQVYEIKTGLDNLERLPGQLNSYYQAFKYVTIVTDESHLQGVTALLANTDAGIILLTKRTTLHVVQEPQEHPQQLSRQAMFKTLRKPEYEAVLASEYSQLPTVDQFHYYRECLHWFEQLDIEVCHQAMLKALKKRSQSAQHEALLKQVPVALRELVYFAGYREKDYVRLLEFLDQPI
ncbi:hypothetical protein LHA01_24770 [Schleiferilactobacillus harbinensis]|nr:hypothetical protein LHA01_24770 [Schleiferilactobacillus harbinensis]